MSPRDVGRRGGASVSELCELLAVLKPRIDLVHGCQCDN